MSDGTDYPDLEPDGLGDLHEIRRIPGMAKPGRVPQIRWGGEYKSWPVEKRLKYAERLASSMNHAADILQQERDKLLLVVQHQEKQIKALGERFDSQGQIVNRRLGKENAKQQELNKLIVSLTAELKEKNKRLQQLEAEREG